VAFAVPWLAHLARATAAAATHGAERQWMERSAALADAARRHAAVTGFRGDIEAHRDKLRQIVRSDGEKTPQPVVRLHRTMILVNALLHAAAECQQGGRLVCPADLMRQLDGQIAEGFSQLQAIEKGTR
jgi:hypothetical protein